MNVFNDILQGDLENEICIQFFQVLLVKREGL